MTGEPDKSIATSKDSLRHAAKEWGFDFPNFSTVEQRVWEEQERYLVQYRRARTKTHAARYAGVHCDTAFAWIRNDALSFRRRLEVADQAFKDDLETLALDRIRDGTYTSNPDHAHCVA